MLAKEVSKIAVHKDILKPVICTDLDCEDCLFTLTRLCPPQAEEWCNTEYKEPEVDWSEVKVDTPVLVSNDKKTWFKGYFSKYKNGKVFVWKDGSTSWSSGSYSSRYSKDIHYNYAKLAESEEE